MVTKAYMKNTRVFADTFNYFLYGGRQVIDPAKLHIQDTTEIAMPYGEKKTIFPVQKYRDNLDYLSAMHDEHAAYLLLGIENQAEIHYAMAVKNMVYDALQYASQVEKAAKSHRKKKESKKKDQELLQFIPNYRINLIAPAQMDDESMNKLQSSLREVLLYIKYSEDKKKLKEILTTDDRFKRVEKDAAIVINTITNSKFEFDEKEEIVNMCKAMVEIRAEMREELIEEIREELKEEVKEELKEEAYKEEKISSICSLMETVGFTAEQAMSALKIPEEQYHIYRELL